MALETLLGMAIALVIHSNFRGRGGVRTAMLVPWAIPTVVSAVMWQWMYNDVYGIVNDILVNRLHVLDHKVAWLADPQSRTPSHHRRRRLEDDALHGPAPPRRAAVHPWRCLRGVVRRRREQVAAVLQITLPLLRPALLVALIFRTLDAFRVFDVVYVMKRFAPETMTVAVYARQQLIDLAGSVAGRRRQ